MAPNVGRKDTLRTPAAVEIFYSVENHRPDVSRKVSITVTRHPERARESGTAMFVRSISITTDALVISVVRRLAATLIGQVIAAHVFNALRRAFEARVRCLGPDSFGEPHFFVAAVWFRRSRFGTGADDRPKYA